MDERIIDRIRRNIEGAVLTSEPLGNHTTYRVGGRAEVLVEPRTSREAAWTYLFARREGIPLAVIGAGSNVIAPDEGMPGIVLRMKTLAPAVRFRTDGAVRVDAGCLLHELVLAAVKRGLSGIEPLAWIPGTVGGAIVMNAGTRATDVSERLTSAAVLTPSGRKLRLARDDLSLGYRTSMLLDSGWLVLSAEFHLSPGDRARLMETLDQSLVERERTYPLDLPSAGSVFKRPPGDYAGRLIEAAGCKGMRVGDAMVSERHANFIVNVGAARAADILELISRVRRRVFETSGVYLELEQIPLCQPRSGARGDST
jgi:UDP-N-acetylmuramate dehydrogenase